MWNAIVASTAAVLVIGGCKSEVVVAPSGDGGGSQGAGGSGGTGGATTACSNECVECCNPAACPPEAPVLGDDCSEQPGDYCGYILDNGCLETYYCEPSLLWTKNSEKECSSGCKDYYYPDTPCLLEARQCQYEATSQCWLATCTVAHKWDIEYVGEGTCP